MQIRFLRQCSQSISKSGDQSGYALLSFFQNGNQDEAFNNRTEKLLF